MATGDKILSTKRNSTMDSIDNARAKWGLVKIGNKVSSGTKTTSTDYNNLVNWLTEAKNKAGASTDIEAKVSIGEIMKEAKLNNLVSQANAIYNWCVCYGNCKGSCTGSCTGNCTSTCSGSCSGKCSNGRCSVRHDGNDSGH